MYQLITVSLKQTRWSFSIYPFKVIVLFHFHCIWMEQALEGSTYYVTMFGCLFQWYVPLSVLYWEEIYHLEIFELGELCC